jgi:mannan endo-1,4-beta-mannosidase
MSLSRRLTAVAVRTATATAAALALTLTAIGAAPQPASAAAGFVDATGGRFTVDGTPLRFGGTNNYYLIYGTRAMVDDVFADARAMNLTVIRAWAALDIGSLDGSVPHIDGGPKADVYFQYWNPATGAPAYNDGPNGLERLDYALARAREFGIRLILPFVNNWREFGGIDQYVTWYRAQFHDAFYTDPRIRQAYKNWITHLLNRTNTITGVKYKDDPTIFSWELGNEPRCINANLPTSGQCTTQTLVAWAREMSAHVKSQDPNHMLSVGDEGFLARNRPSDWPYNAADGVDHEALTSLPNIDYGTFHLYPDHWSRTPEWGTQWIKDHQAAADAYGKPVILEEFGMRDQARRDATYQTWTETVRSGTGDGWNFWILTGIDWSGGLYPDYDGFRVIYPSANATVLAGAAAAIGGDGPPPPPPPPPPPVSCRVGYAVQNDWGSGFTAQVTITNTGSASIEGWTLEFTFPGDQWITQGWHADWSQDGSSVTARNLDWTRTIAAGSSVTIGFNASRSAANTSPSTFTVNDASCAV